MERSKGMEWAGGFMNSNLVVDKNYEKRKKNSKKEFCGMGRVTTVEKGLEDRAKGRRIQGLGEIISLPCLCFITRYLVELIQFNWIHYCTVLVDLRYGGVNGQWNSHRITSNR